MSDRRTRNSAVLAAAALIAAGCGSGPEQHGSIRVAIDPFAESRVDSSFGHLRLAETAAAAMAEQFSQTPGFALVLDAKVLEKTRTSWEFLSEDPSREIPVTAGSADARVTGEISVDRGEIRASASWNAGAQTETVEVRGPAGSPDRNRLLLRELALRLAARASPGDPVLLVRLGITLREEGLLREAVEAYRSAITLAPSLAAAHYNLGVALDTAGGVEGANESYARAVAADPTHVFARHNRALNLLRQRQPSESPESFSARVREAETLLEEALRLSPRMQELHELLIEALRLQGEYSRAAEACARMQKIFPGEGRPHELLGLTYLSAGRFGEAAAQFRKASELEPSIATHVYSLARALEGAGKAGEAVNAYLEFMTRAGSDPIFARACEDASKRAEELRARLEKKG